MEKGNTMKKKLIYKLLVMGTLVGCGAKKDQTDPQILRGNSGLETRNVNELADKILFECRDKNCPTSYGLILNGKNRRAENFHCSGFFVAKNIIATSSNCVRDSYVKDSNLCGQNFAVKDIFNNSAVCKKVLFKSEGTSSRYKVDFALVELDRELDVEPVKINVGGFKSRESYSFWKATKSYKNDVFTLKKNKYCRVTKRNIRYPHTSQGSGKTSAFKNCPVKIGHTGAGMVNSNGETVGLIWGGEKRSYDYDRYMNGKAGRSLMYASPLSCVINSLPTYFPGHKISEKNKKECEKKKSTRSLRQYFSSLTRVFYSKKKALTNKVFTIKHKKDSVKSFYNVEHEKCVADTSINVRVCEFFPSLNSYYELRDGNLEYCYSSKRVTTGIQATLWGEFSLDVFVDGKFFTQFELPACN